MTRVPSDGTGANESGRAKRALAYAWFEGVMWATAPLPDFQSVQRLRARLLGPCFKRCGKGVMIAKDVSAAYTTSIELGNDVWVAKGSWLMGFGGIRLEDEAMLGPYTVLTSALHSKHEGSYRFGAIKAAPIVIGKGAWTGAHAVITAGVTVGEGASVAAGCMVTVDVPAGALITGVPGRVLKQAAASEAGPK
jgi:acetyltransferase-like isoleucine patch superfamily enzyme